MCFFLSVPTLLALSFLQCKSFSYEFQGCASLIKEFIHSALSLIIVLDVAFSC